VKNKFREHLKNVGQLNWPETDLRVREGVRKWSRRVTVLPTREKTHTLRHVLSSQQFFFFKSDSPFSMAGDEAIRTGTSINTSIGSTDSRQGTDPLSDAFVVVAVEEKHNDGPARWVEAPRGSDQMYVRRSARVASS
jgi:hypothetical protein